MLNIAMNRVGAWMLLLILVSQYLQPDYEAEGLYTTTYRYGLNNGSVRLLLHARMLDLDVLLSEHKLCTSTYTI